MKSLNTEDIVEFFNSLIPLDPEAFDLLFKMRAACNQAIEDHTTVQVRVDGNRTKVGFIGILNGLLVAHGQPRICMCTNESGDLVGFDIYEVANDSK